MAPVSPRYPEILLPQRQLPALAPAAPGHALRAGTRVSQRGRYKACEPSALSRPRLVPTAGGTKEAALRRWGRRLPTLPSGLRREDRAAAGATPRGLRRRSIGAYPPTLAPGQRGALLPAAAPWGAGQPRRPRPLPRLPNRIRAWARPLASVANQSHR